MCNLILCELLSIGYLSFLYLIKEPLMCYYCMLIINRAVQLFCWWLNKYSFIQVEEALHYVIMLLHLDSTFICCPHSYVFFVPPRGRKSTAQCKNNCKNKMADILAKSINQQLVPKQMRAWYETLWNIWLKLVVFMFNNIWFDMLYKF